MMMMMESHMITFNYQKLVNFNSNSKHITGMQAYENMKESS